jgi:voltage-gated potassium channel
MDFVFEFIKISFSLLLLFSPLITFLCVLIVGLGLVVGHFEGWTRFNAIYWAFITALTVGYGDFHPLLKKTKVIAVLIVFLGYMMTGVMVSVTVTGAGKAFEKHVDQEKVQMLKDRYGAGK